MFTKWFLQYFKTSRPSNFQKDAFFSVNDIIFYITDGSKKSCPYDMIFWLIHTGSIKTAQWFKKPELV